MSVGRPTILDDLLERRITDALRAGHSRKGAARCAGITYDCVRKWLRRGEAAAEGDERFVAFVARVDAAEHVAERRAVEVVTNLFDSKDERVRLTAAQWWLQRRRPEEWAEPGKATAEGAEEAAARATDAHDLPLLESLVAAAKSRVGT